MSYRLRSPLCLCQALGTVEVTLRRQPVPALAEDMRGIWYN